MFTNFSQKFVMEESPAMTIKSLRDRLSAERVISKIARQEADDLAKRVKELEEQLRIVNLQRKKAEKATSGVLAILENKGNDFSEAYESGSDQDGVLSELKEDDCCRNEEGMGVPRQVTSEIDDLSGMELGASRTNSRSLSSESPTDSPISVERKTRVDQARREVSNGRSPRKHVKSRRFTNHKDMRSEALELNNDSVLSNGRENGAATISGNTSNCSGEASENLDNDCKYENANLSSVGMAKQSPKILRKEDKDGNFCNGCDKDGEMEQALAHKAQLICRYEDEENDQKEWEEKFRDNNSSPDSYEVGNRSDITEERDEVKDESAETVHTTCHGQGDKSGVNDVQHSAKVIRKSLPKRSLPQHIENGCSQEQQCSNLVVNESEIGCAEFSFPDQESLERKSNGNLGQGWSENSSFCSQSRGSSEHQAGKTFSSPKVSGSVYKGESSRDERRVARHHETSNGLEGVLEALQRAKLSLTNGLSRLPPSAQGTLLLRANEAPVRAAIPGESMEIPSGYGGLFRVPSNSHFQDASTTPRSNGPYTTPSSSMTRYNTSYEVEVSAGDRYANGRNLDILSGTSIKRLPIDPYVNTGMGLPDSSRYMYPSYLELMPRMVTNDRLKGVYPRATLEMPARDQDHYSMYDQMRLNMHTRQ